METTETFRPLILPSVEPGVNEVREGLKLPEDLVIS